MSIYSLVQMVAKIAGNSDKEACTLEKPELSRILREEWC